MYCHKMKVLIVILCVFLLADITLQEHYSDDDEPFPQGLEKRLLEMELRIIGGADVTPHSQPYQAVVLTTYKNGDESLCGGTLINPRWILTAAHCIDGNPRYIDIILGAHKLTSKEETVQTFRSKSYKKHADYDEDLYLNDIALVKLPKNASLNTWVSVVELSTDENDTYAGENGTIVGWGLTENGSISETLKSVSVEVMSNEACKKMNRAYEIIVESHVCVSGTGPKGSCGGDSGGPLLVNGTQIGVVAFGPDNCTLGMPSVFTRLNRYNDWIVENMNSNAGLFKVRNVFFVVVLVVIVALIHAVIDALV